MYTFDASEAQTDLCSLLDRVERDERISITRHGRPVAVLAPVEAEGKERLTPAEILAEMRIFRARTKPDSMSVRDSIAEGRRY